MAISDGSNPSNPWDTGLHDVTPDGLSVDAVKLTGETEVTVDVAVEGVTAGKLVGLLRYFVSD